MATTEILPFATGISADVESQAAYAAESSTTNGFGTGTAFSSKLNKVWRQSSFMAAGLANWLVAQGVNVPDDGDLTTLTNNLIANISSVKSSVVSISALRGLDKTKYSRSLVTGYYAIGDGGGGIYYYDSSDTTSTDNGGTIIVATDNGRWKLLDQSHITPATFGCDTTGVADCSVQVLKAINYCATTGRTLWIDATPAPYNLTLPVVAAAMCSIDGDGETRAGFNWAGAAGGVPFTYNLVSQNIFIHQRNFFVQGSTVGNGLHGIVVNITNGDAIFANSSIKHVALSNFTSYGLLLDNSLNAISALFTLTIEENYICNGLKIIKNGDSNNILSNNISMTSTTVGNTCIGIWIIGVPGAAQLVVRGNNVTAGGGGMLLDSCDQPRWGANQFEFPYYRATGPNFPFTTNANNGNAMVRFVNCYSAIDEGNNVNTGFGSSDNTCASAAVFFDGAGTKYCTLRGSNIVKGSSYHVVYDNGAVGNIIGKNNWQQTTAPIIYMNAPWVYPQVGVMLPITLLNSWVLDTTNGETACNLLLDESGIGHLFGAVDGGTGTVFQLVAAVVPTQLTRSGTIYHSSAGAITRMDTGGTFIVQTSPGTGATLNSITFPYRLAL